MSDPHAGKYGELTPSRQRGGGGVEASALPSSIHAPRRFTCSIPDVFLIVFHIVFLQQSSEFLFEIFLPMMFHLICDVVLKRLDMRRAEENAP